MAYATWEDYKSKYLLGREPSIPQKEFPFWAQQASTYVDAVTFERLHDVDTLASHETAVILAVCALAEHLYATAESRGITSVSVTGHSIAYDKTGKEQTEIVRLHLGNTGLLYRGV